MCLLVRQSGVRGGRKLWSRRRVGGEGRGQGRKGGRKRVLERKDVAGCSQTDPSLVVVQPLAALVQPHLNFLFVCLFCSTKIGFDSLHYLGHVPSPQQWVAYYLFLLEADSMLRLCGSLVLILIASGAGMHDLFNCCYLVSLFGVTNYRSNHLSISCPQCHK